MWFSPPVPIPSNPSITVKIIREDDPAFAREYSVILINGIRLKVRLKTSYGIRFDMSELDQANGQWVLFDVHSPADKILDRELLPYVKAACKEILREDADYVATNPNQFTDQNGHIWQRVK